ncbi:hypothetical protein M3A49_35365 [Paraburkholderia sp. CNPSo 3076]|uniref:hypothetical protein n=1 Tax=Paraburkholderia sp. CNPSo 3076 TaxID=2940936 RepID=UPI002251931D|nr:hypothetical protein [Paraburkholderia sp. CNPSo 3076]MCX5544686.1 hypothetical protein [Paraburkholderia sp. CNPSo 3076]
MLHCPDLSAGLVGPVRAIARLGTHKHKRNHLLKAICMGQLTANATGVLHIVSEEAKIAADAMAAAVAVKRPDGHLDFTYFEHFVLEDGYHVALRLMRALDEHYGNVASIPSGATVVFVARWSPCKECTTVLIPDFLRRADIAKKGIRVKFRFENYYVKGAYPRKVSEEHIWKTVGDALAVYETLSRQYGEHELKFADRDPVSGALTVNVKRRVVLATAQVAKTSTVETWLNV